MPTLFVNPSFIPNSIDSLKELGESPESSLLFITLFIVLIGGIFVLYSFVRLFSGQKSIVNASQKMSDAFSLSIESLEKISAFITNSENRIIQNQKLLSDHLKSTEIKFIDFLKMYEERIRKERDLEYKNQKINIKNLEDKISDISNKLSKIVSQELHLDHKQQNFFIDEMMNKLKSLIDKVKDFEISQNKIIKALK